MVKFIIIFAFKYMKYHCHPWGDVHVYNGPTCALLGWCLDCWKILENIFSVFIQLEVLCSFQETCKIIGISCRFR